VAQPELAPTAKPCMHQAPAQAALRQPGNRLAASSPTTVSKSVTPSNEATAGSIFIPAPDIETIEFCGVAASNGP
jgi:hypothetical protein